MERKKMKLLKDIYDIEESISEFVDNGQSNLTDVFKKIDTVKEYNQLKVMAAMKKHRLSETHFYGSTGYGYGDRGREITEMIYSDVFGTEDALVRHSFAAGTHTIATALSGILRPGDELLSITGKPYDTLEEVIGIRESGSGSLIEFGINYSQLELKEDGSIDLEVLDSVINKKTRLVFLQRSAGYSWRHALGIKDISEAVKRVKDIRKDIVVMVDNCYGEFTEKEEPGDAGADITAGSLIKNPGGGIALSGGYIAGKNELVELSACRLTSPGLGRKVGATLGQNRFIIQGLFLAPHVVAESLKGAALCSCVMETAGFETLPSFNGYRSDIIQSIKFNDPQKLIAFCQGIQSGSPVDAHVLPQPWDMPGYDSQVIMAAGGFVQGSSIELSADGPLKSPYIAYLQGGMVYESVKLGLMSALQIMKNRGLWEVK